MMHNNRRKHSRKAGSATTIEAIQTLFKREDTLRALTNHVVSKENPAKEECPSLAEINVAVSKTALIDTITSIPCLIEEVVSALVTAECCKRFKRTDTRLQAMMQGLVSMTIEEKLNSLEFVRRLLRKIEEAAMLRQHMTNITRDMLDS